MARSYPAIRLKMESVCRVGQAVPANNLMRLDADNLQNELVLAKLHPHTIVIDSAHFLKIRPSLSPFN